MTTMEKQLQHVLHADSEDLVSIFAERNCTCQVCFFHGQSDSLSIHNGGMSLGAWLCCIVYVKAHITLYTITIIQKWTQKCQIYNLETCFPVEICDCARWSRWTRIHPMFLLQTTRPIGSNRPRAHQTVAGRASAAGKTPWLPSTPNERKARRPTSD